MNETEAAEKVCPLTLGRETAPGKCVGSGCMAWRVTGKEYTGKEYTGRNVIVKNGPRHSSEREMRDTGECGMVPGGSA